MNINADTTTAFYQQQEKRLRAEWGDALYEQVMALPDDDEEQERAIPTLVIGRDQPHSTVFIQLQDRKEVEHLISQLASLLTYNSEEYGISVQGQVTSFGEYCDRHLKNEDRESKNEE
ncbi:MAG: hypothetical protein F6K30_19210 [Cyanothece sp. SIO2G6]|nr:hypothetical protein [Cyanothece sp. SIO2G6]